MNYEAWEWYVSYGSCWYVQEAKINREYDFENKEVIKVADVAKGFMTP